MIRHALGEVREKSQKRRESLVNENAPSELKQKKIRMPPVSASSCVASACNLFRLSSMSNTDPFNEDAALVDAELVSWVKDRVTLSGFVADMWKEEFAVAISEFLTSTQACKLIMFLVLSLCSTAFFIQTCCSSQNVTLNRNKKRWWSQRLLNLASNMRLKSNIFFAALAIRF
jgi:hypothetical protein